MTRASLLLPLVLLFIVQSQSAARQAPAPTPTQRDLVGTWTLNALEQGIGAAQPTRVANPRGLLILDSAGHAFEFVTSVAAQRAPLGQQAPLADAPATFAGFGGFWGAYRLDPTQKRIVFKPEAGISTLMTSAREFSRAIDYAGDRLVVTSIGEPHAAGGTRWTWERVPTVDNLSPLYRRVVGFWQHIVERRVNMTTKAVVSETRRSPSVIVYTPSGFVGVHFPPLNRKPFASETPTPEEARAALQGYIAYYGTLGVYPGEVFHNILGGLSPTQGTILRRFADIEGDELTVRLQPGRNQQGQEATTATIVVLKRLSGVDEMLPPR
jgi:Lipocalin-like domain